ncbi:hypothetical protein EG68_00584 [Paragonimus skrjabini miyazakii]|uniref:Uncharacterized protein n=1 Tax=Paragonimus skrjabini miyazakii TaxID=59628 RepID=A0A8S9Z3X2_9TREM|nr:hypothetical protein EG68_00584 [Paragonimus skrjabini miyazakii]
MCSFSCIFCSTYIQVACRSFDLTRTHARTHTHTHKHRFSSSRLWFKDLDDINF